jgi:hypothetical protein
MKLKLLASLFIILTQALSGFGQHLPIDPETNKVAYVEEVQLDTMVRSSSIQSACKDWFSNYYKDAPQTPLGKKFRGGIARNANFPVFKRLYGRGGADIAGGFMEYTISVSVGTKGRYCITISDFMHKDPATGNNFGAPENFYAVNTCQSAVMKYYMDQINVFSTELIESLKSYVESNTIEM